MKRFFQNCKSLIFKKENQILFIILGMLGFSMGCEDVISPRAEYGTPSAEFILNGSVKSSTTEQAIQNIRVIVEPDTLYDGSGSMYMVADTLYTDENGTFRFDDRGFPGKKYLNVHLADVDGDANGNFGEKTVAVVFEDGPYTGGDGWFSGKIEQNIDISLDETDEK